MQMHSQPDRSRNFEFSFVSLLATHLEAPTHADADDVGLLHALGRDGWEVKGVTVDPRMPAARLLVLLQRPAS